MLRKRETGYVHLVTSHYLLEKSQIQLQLNSSISYKINESKNYFISQTIIVQDHDIEAPQTNQANLVVRQGLEWCRTVHFFVSRFCLLIAHLSFRLNYRFQVKIKNIDKKSRWLRKLKSLYHGRIEFFMNRYRRKYQGYHLEIRIN